MSDAPTLREQLISEGVVIPNSACWLPWQSFELPEAPSKNRKMWKLGNSTPEVVEWGRQAEMAFMTLPHETRRSLRATMFCEFEAVFLHGRNKRADFHNYEEFVFDWLQSRGFIANDKQCEWRSSGWTDDLPKGRVRVFLRPWQTTRKEITCVSFYLVP